MSRKNLRMFILDFFKYIRYNGIFTDILGNVIPGIINPLVLVLLLIDHLLKSLAEYLRRDVSLPLGSVIIQLPMILLKKRQERCKGTVWNLQFWILEFEFVLSEEIDIERWHFSQCSWGFWQA